MSDTAQDTSKFQIFRAADALDVMEANCITPGPMTDAQIESFMKIMEAGYTEGEEIKVLCNMPGFSLVYSWFKPGFPLPLHSHDADCLCYIVSGSLRLGTEELGPRDTFFVPCDVPYTYKVGPEGLEILEFRHNTTFNFVNLAKSQSYWDKATTQVEENRGYWQNAKRPALNIA